MMKFTASSTLILFLFSVALNIGHTLAVLDDAYDCVNIHEQPSLKHPLLKNHKIQLKPSPLIQSNYDGTTSIDNEVSALLTKINCQHGTVPVRRATKDDLIRSQSLSDSYTPLSDFSPGQHYAIVQRPKSDEIFYGSQASIESLNPKVRKDQLTFALISLWSGPIGKEDLIQAGWAVGLYPDNLTRLTIWTRSKLGGCYDLIFCRGFVQVHQRIPVSGVLKTTVDPKEPVMLDLSLTQDERTKDWWLMIGSASIGYWPSTIFTHLNKGATGTSFGGLAKQSPDGLSPPMGLGTIPNGDTEQTGYFDQVKVMYGYGQPIPPSLLNFDWYADQRDCYDVINHGEIADHRGYVISYGGPGGRCGI